MNTIEWNLPRTRNWVIQRCWEDHMQNPGGPGLLLQPENLQPDDPPYNLVCEAVEYLLGKGRITAKFEGMFGGKTIITGLRLTPQAIVNIQDQLEREPTRPIGFRTEG